MKELFWIKCERNEDEYYNKRVVNPCNRLFALSEEGIFEKDDVDYFGETIERYYTICPNCGYIVLIDKDRLTDNMVELANDKNLESDYVFKKNQLISELVHLNYLEKNGKTRVRKR